MRTHWIHCVALTALGMLGTGLLTACGAGDAGSELAMRPKPRAIGARAVLRIPQEEPFSITLSSAQETPGLQGEAGTEKRVTDDGNADAEAWVRHGGTAQATFQIGQAVANDSDQQVQLRVTARCSYETMAETVPPGPFADAQVSLTLYARDGRNRLLRSLKFIAHSTEEGAASSANTKEVTFELTLGAREWVNIFVAGDVQVETTPEREARGKVELRGLEMVIETEPAPPVGMENAGDERA